MAQFQTTLKTMTVSLADERLGEPKRCLKTHYAIRSSAIPSQSSSWKRLGLQLIPSRSIKLLKVVSAFLKGWNKDSSNTRQSRWLGSHLHGSLCLPTLDSAAEEGRHGDHQDQKDQSSTGGNQGNASVGGLIPATVLCTWAQTDNHF